MTIHRLTHLINLIGICFAFFQVYDLQGQYAEVDLNYYLPVESYDQSITLPEEYLGYQVGQRHISHDELVEYLNILDKESPRITLDTYALSHELRPLIVLTITSEENHNRIDEIQTSHVDLVRSPDRDNDISDLPSVLYQGYSIHGDEASGSNAAMLTAYYLAASRASFTKDLLDNSVILFDPSMNPDGLHRFSTWVNSHRSSNLNPDPMSIEFHERWPTGRGNHYWFDLNRDWLLLAHPESRGRVGLFHQWYPNVLTDHHEMGKHTTFFFQPGVPERTNLLTPQRNQDLTEEISHFHIKYLDSIGSDYFTKERFDDYYYGKGSTYPDALGSVGILFEQAGVEGHLQETNNGLLSFPFAIRNQVVTSFSTWESCLDMRKDLVEYKQAFFQNRIKDAAADSIKGYHLSSEDSYVMSYLEEWFDTHHIESQQEGTNGLYISLDQPQYILLKSMMEPTVEFPDSIFYDVSTWTLPMAFDLEVRAEHSVIAIRPSSDEDQIPQLPSLSRGQQYIINWGQYMAPKALQALLDSDVSVEVLKQPKKVNQIVFEAGSMIVPSNATVDSLLRPIVENGEIEILALDRSKISKKQIQTLKSKEIALLIGRGANGYDAGSIWYTLDNKWDVPVTLLDITRNLKSALDRYDVIIMPSNIRNMHPIFSEKLIEWIDDGGQFIGIKSAMDWGIDQNLTTATRYAPDRDNLSERERGVETIGGAILNVNVDTLSPLGYGYSDGKMEVFHRGNTFYKSTAGLLPMTYSENPVASGFVSESNRLTIPNTAAAVITEKGEGTCIFLMDNPCFRGYWLQGGALLGNAIWMVE